MDRDIPGFGITVNLSTPYVWPNPSDSQCWSPIVQLAVYPTTLETILAQRDKDYGDKIVLFLAKKTCHYQCKKGKENVRISILSSLMKMREFPFTVVVSLLMVGLLCSDTCPVVVKRRFLEYTLV